MLSPNTLTPEPQNSIVPTSNIGVENNTPLKKIKELFKSSIGLTWSKKWRFLFLNIIPKILGVLPLFLVFIIYAITTIFIKETTTIKIVLNIILGLAGLIGLVVLIAYSVFWSQSAYVNYLQTGEESKKVILKNSRKKVWGLIWVYLLTVMASFGYLLFFMIIATLFYIFVSSSAISIIIGIIIFFILLIYSVIRLIRFGNAPMAFLVEDIHRTAALKRSSELSKGYRWSIFKRELIYVYFQFSVQIIFSIIFALIGLLLGTSILSIIGAIIFAIIFLLMLFVNLLLEPFKFIYDFDIYNNLKLNKQNTSAQEKYSLGQKFVVLLLMILFPIIAIIFSLLTNLINPNQNDSSNQTVYSLLEKVGFKNGQNEITNETTNSVNDNAPTKASATLNSLIDNLIPATDTEIAGVNKVIVEAFKNSSVNIDKIEMPAYSEESFKMLMSASGADTEKVKQLSLEKKKYLWNNFYLSSLETKF